VVALLIAGREVLYPVRALLWHVKAIIWWLAILGGSLGQGALAFKWLRGDRLDLPAGMALGATCFPLRCCCSAPSGS
jgi:hypothetical protein